VTAAAEKLDGELSMALDELRRTRELEQQAQEVEQRACEARLNASARLLRLEKVREKVRSKEYRLVEQGLKELKVEEQKASEVLLLFI
jgi:vacuolar-type H+-ATPase subunit I/STV1